MEVTLTICFLTVGILCFSCEHDDCKVTGLTVSSGQNIYYKIISSSTYSPQTNSWFNKLNTLIMWKELGHEFGNFLYKIPFKRWVVTYLGNNFLCKKLYRILLELSYIEKISYIRNCKHFLCRRVLLSADGPILFKQNNKILIYKS